VATFNYFAATVAGGDFGVAGDGFLIGYFGT